MPENVIAVAPGGPFNETSLPFDKPDTSNLTYIGDVAEWEAGLPVFETPFELDPKPYIYRLNYKVVASAFASLARDAEGPYGGYHVGENNFRPEIGGILSFIREFARVPDSRNEFESYIYSYQYGVDGTSILEYPTTVTSRVQYDYFRTNNPESIELPRAPRLVNIGSFVYEIEHYLDLEPGDVFLAEDAILRVWKGTIYERIQRFVEWRDFTTEG